MTQDVKTQAGQVPPAAVPGAQDVKPVAPQVPAPDPKQVPQTPAAPAAGTQTDPALLLRSLQEERDRRRTAEARYEQVKTVYGDRMAFDANGNPIAPQQPPVQQPNQDAEFQKKLEELWQTNPREAVRVEIAMATQYSDRVSASLEAQRAAVRAKYADFDKYEGQAMAYVRTLPLETRAKENMVEVAYLIRRGQDAENIYKQATEDVIKRIQAGESVQGISGGSYSQPQTPTGTQPTQDQLKVAEMMGLSPEAYMKGKR